VLQDFEVALSEIDINEKQTADLEIIESNCRNTLLDLEKTLDRYGELDSSHGAAGKRAKRIWKRLQWEPEEVRELRDRITSNCTSLNLYLQRASR
jgi:hypothetical protein